MKKKKWKIFIIILLCILILVGWIVYNNWNTVLGVIDGLRYSQEDVEQQQEENKKELQKFLDENENVTVRDLTDEEIKALANGEINQEDAVQIITGQKTLDEVKADKIHEEETGNTENDILKNESDNSQGQTENEVVSQQGTSVNKPEVSKPVAGSKPGETKSETGKQPVTGTQTTTEKAPVANSQSGSTDNKPSGNKQPEKNKQPSDNKQPEKNKQPSGDKQPVTNNQQTSGLMPDVTAPKDAAPVSTEGKTSDQIVSELIASLYVQKSVYLSTLDGLEAEIGAEFEKLPAKEKPIQKPKIIAKYMPIIAEWEKNCDRVVYEILD